MKPKILFPNYANEQQLGTKTYEEHVARFIETVRPALVSWDHYALFENGERENYFENLEIVRRLCLKAKVPFVQIILATPHGPYRDPNEADFRWQVYTTLCYGAKGVLYFTYWTPHDPTWNFRNGIIAQDGKRTAHYEMLRRLNRQVNTLSKTLMGLRSVGVYHTAPIPMGARGLDSEGPVKEVEGGSMVIGWLKDNSDRNHLFIVNRSFKEKAQVRLTFAQPVRTVWEISQETGRAQRVSYQASRRTLEVPLEPGEGKLFRLGR